ncbi:MAG: MBL fold metallo-hydrolase [Clostridiales bacterium]|nr:MBL fold metallo-hydrolase [Clostridiales bacterium]
MRIKTFTTRGMDENCYLIICEETSCAIAVDPGDKFPELSDFLRENGISLKAIVLTHAHYDHIGGLQWLKEKTKAPVVIGENEAQVLASPEMNLSPMFGADPLSMTADRLLKDGEEFSFGSLTFKTIETPGHTPGGICLYFKNEGVLFSGDSLFAMSIGRTDFPGGSYKSLVTALKEKVMTLPEETKVFPGHGPKTSVAAERKLNPYL